jgi:hypothetical protein
LIYATIGMDTALFEIGQRLPTTHAAGFQRETLASGITELQGCYKSAGQMEEIFRSCGKMNKGKLSL